MRNFSLVRLFIILIFVSASGCKNSKTVQSVSLADTSTVQPVIITEPVKYDTDDPAIWVNRKDPAASLIIGTDKEKDGALYVFDLNGKIKENLVVRRSAKA